MATSPQRARSIGATPVAVASRALRAAERVDAAPRVKSGNSALLVQRLVLVGLDIAVVNLAFYLAWYARYRLSLFIALDPGNYVEHAVYLRLQVGLAVTFAIMLALRGLYRLP